jgi:hypothetical protein
VALCHACKKNDVVGEDQQERNKPNRKKPHQTLVHRLVLESIGFGIKPKVGEIEHAHGWHESNEKVISRIEVIFCWFLKRDLVRWCPFDGYVEKIFVEGSEPEEKIWQFHSNRVSIGTTGFNHTMHKTKVRLPVTDGSF